MPAVVASGRQPDVYACGFCHRASGTGGPENADIAGLPVAYFIQQLHDYRSGRRSTALSDRVPQAWMISLAKAANDDEIRAAAEYFAAIKPKKLVDVVETETVPKPTVAGWFFVTKGDEREPIGARIIETPADVGRFVNRDARVRFTAYVPTGSVAAGRGLAARPEIACAACHGDKLTGTDVVPGIAGRSPTYIFRQLYEYRHGFRAGPESKPMIDVVKALNEADFFDTRRLSGHAGAIKRDHCSAGKLAFVCLESGTSSRLLATRCRRKLQPSSRRLLKLLNCPLGPAFMSAFKAI